MNNFYTSTVYNKGAEVVRMYDTILKYSCNVHPDGKAVDKSADKSGFRRGMDLYFERFDGCVYMYMCICV